MLSILGQPASGGTTRRALLQAAGTGLLGLSLPKLFAAEESAETKRHPAKAKSVIFLFLFGGPSQLETFDLKPESPRETRGPFRSMPSKTPGLLISDQLPKLAACSDKYCVIRNMSHSFNDHSGAAHYMQTGRRWHVPIGGGFVKTSKDWPSMGSVVEYFGQRDPGGVDRDLPNYVVTPNWLGRLQEKGQYRRPGEYASWLGHGYNGMTTRIDKRNLNDNPYWRGMTDAEADFRIVGLDPPTIELDRLEKRRSLLEQFDAKQRFLDRSDTHKLDRLRARAFALLSTGRTKEALDVRRESEATRERYGKHLFGQSTLLARRLVEAGVRFVTVHYDACDGYSWDSHRNSHDVKKHLLPTLDQSLSALICDLDERGLLDETLVVAVGEMGRTPKANKAWGRDHWSTLFPAVIAGAGVRGGVAYGSSDKVGAHPRENPTSPEDLAATIYDALGIDPSSHIYKLDGQPV
ncbi:MAG: DUF1501 domain-containing protein, partial [Planctomycetota bacterium]